MWSLINSSCVLSNDCRTFANANLQPTASISTRSPFRNRITFTGTQGNPSFRVPFSTSEQSISIQCHLFGGTGIPIFVSLNFGLFDRSFRTISRPPPMSGFSSQANSLISWDASVPLTLNVLANLPATSVLAGSQLLKVSHNWSYLSLSWGSQGKCFFFDTFASLGGLRYCALPISSY